MLLDALIDFRTEFLVAKRIGLKKKGSESESEVKESFKSPRFKFTNLMQRGTLHCSSLLRRNVPFALLSGGSGLCSMS